MNEKLHSKAADFTFFVILLNSQNFYQFYSADEIPLNINDIFIPKVFNPFWQKYTRKKHISCKEGKEIPIECNNSFIPDRPVCQQTSPSMYEANKHQTLTIQCKMASNPKQNLEFSWSFNNSINNMDIPVSFLLHSTLSTYRVNIN